MRRKMGAALLAVCLCTVSGWQVSAAEPLVGIFAPADDLDIGMVEQTNANLSQMSREQKVGQMLLVSPSQLANGGDWTVNIDMVIQNMQNFYVGGLIFFAEDLTNPDAVKALMEKVNAMEGIPALTMADAGGSLTAGLTKPDETISMHIGPYAIGAENIWCYSTIQTPSEKLQELGILLDATPGLSPETGADYVIVTHAKVDYASVSEVSGLEHLEADDGRPASMARSMVTEQLRGTSEFAGVVMTDSLSMPEATQSYGSDMAVMYALQAGADILTAPSNVLAAYYGIHSAIDEQLVTEEQINESVARILEAKTKLGLFTE